MTWKVFAIYSLGFVVGTIVQKAYDQTDEAALCVSGVATLFLLDAAWKDKK